MTEDELIAYVDGELAPDATRRFEAALAGDAALKAKIERLREQRQALNAAFAAVLEEPVPERLRKAAMTGAVSPGFRLRAWSTGWRISLPQVMAATTAALVIGVVAGRYTADGGLVAQHDAAMIAQGSLARALETRLAADNGPGIRPGVTFRNSDKQICRTFSASAMAGVACKNGGNWQIAALVPAESEASGDFQPAGSAMPNAIRDSVNQMIEGTPFDAFAEKQARDRGWK